MKMYQNWTFHTPQCEKLTEGTHYHYKVSSIPLVMPGVPLQCDGHL